MNTKLNTLNRAMDVLSYDDTCGLDNIFRQFTVLITSFAVDKLKTASSRHDFNEVLERFLRRLLHHHQCDQSDVADEEREAAASKAFFSSCLGQLLVLSAPTRRLFAQVLRHCSLSPSSPGLLSALLSLLDAHPQKATFDTLTEFLALWLLGAEQQEAAMEEAGRAIIGKLTVSGRLSALLLLV